MISSNDFRPGVTVEIDGNVWQVVDFQHVKPGKGAAFVRTKMKNLQTGSVVERTFNAGEKVPKAHVDRRRMQYLYESDGSYTFMDNETYDQVELTLEQLGVNMSKKRIHCFCCAVFQFLKWAAGFHSLFLIHSCFLTCIPNYANYY